MPVRIIVLLLLFVHVAAAVRIKRSANRMLTKVSPSQHAVRKNVSEETPKVVGEEVVGIKRIKTSANRVLTTSLGEHAARKSVSEKTSKASAPTSKHAGSLFMFLFLATLSCMIFSCLWQTTDCFKVLLPKPRSCTRRYRRSRKALTVEADSASDRSDIEWCHPDDLVITGALASEVEIIAPHWSAESLKEVLHTHGTNIVCMWTHDQLEHFANELSTGKARLAREDRSLVRVADVLIVLVVYERDKLVLQEFAHPAFKGVAKEEVFIKECTVKSRFRTNEGFSECAERCLQKLGAGIGRFIEIVPDILGMREERRILRSAHPGLPTLMQYYIVEARVVATEQPDLEDLGLISRTLHVADYIYKWHHFDSKPYAKRHLKQSWGASRQGAVTWVGISHSFVPVLPWTENAVLEKLEERGFQGSVAPPPDAMKTLLQALSEGRVFLAVRSGSPPRLVCLEEKVSVVVKSPRKGMVLLSAFSQDGSPILPSVQRYASENYWRTALRLSQTHLGLSAPLFQMEGRVLAVSDKIEDQGFWEHVTREYILQGPLIDCGFIRFR